MINTMTAEAPIEATSVGYAVDRVNCCDTHAIASIAVKHETTEISLFLGAQIYGISRNKVHRDGDVFSGA
jgi:hypothetical protein